MAGDVPRSPGVGWLHTPCFQPGQEPGASFKKSSCLMVLGNGPQPHNCADRQERSGRAVICLASCGQKNLFSKMTPRLGTEWTLILGLGGEVVSQCQSRQKRQERAHSQGSFSLPRRSSPHSCSGPQRESSWDLSPVTQPPNCSSSWFPALGGLTSRILQISH